MKKVLMDMEDQKNSYEQKAKESLQKVLEEKMSAEQQLQSSQVRACGTVLAAGGPGRRWESAARLQGTRYHPLSPLLSLSGPWLWLSRNVNSGGASTRP